MRRLLALVVCLAAAAAVAAAVASAAAAPELTSTTPASPANDSAPVIEGTADPDSAIVLYTTSDCTGAVLEPGVADGVGEFAITIAVADNSTTSVWATAGDGTVSDCSTSSVTYVEDSLAPSPPLVLATSHSTPSSVNTVAIIGFAVAGTTVRLYTTPDCSGAPAALGSADTFNSAGLPVTVADDTTTTFWATAEDIAGNVSSCSIDSILYREDSAAPGTTILTGPGALTGETAATFTFAASEPGAAFACDLDGLGYGFCSSPATYAGLTGGSHTFSVRAIDAAGNTGGSPDLYTWEIDLTIPQTALSSAPDSLTNDRAANFEFGASLAGTTFECSIDGGRPQPVRRRRATPACQTGHTSSASPPFRRSDPATRARPPTSGRLTPRLRTRR